MNPVLNPYAPGAGCPPPELSGRDAVRRGVEICIERLRLGKPAKSVMMVGLHGVGKTVLLDQMRKDAEKTGVHTVRIEAPENRSGDFIPSTSNRLATAQPDRIGQGFCGSGPQGTRGFREQIEGHL